MASLKSVTSTRTHVSVNCKRKKEMGIIKQLNTVMTETKMPKTEQVAVCIYRHRKDGEECVCGGVGGGGGGEIDGNEEIFHYFSTYKHTYCTS